MTTRTVLLPLLLLPCSSSSALLLGRANVRSARCLCLQMEAASRAQSQAIPSSLSTALREHGIAALNPLQQRAVDAAQRGLDMIVHAETGSGKTLCFALPILSQIDPLGPAAQAIVLAPTLELAAQTASVMNALQPGAAAALTREADELPSAPVVVGPPSMLLRLLHGEAGRTELGGRRAAGRRQRASRAVFDSVPAQPQLRAIVLDEADALLVPLGRYATQQQKMKRETKPKSAAVLLESVW